MDEQQFIQLSNKMDTVIKLLALKAVEGKELKIQVSMLSSCGFQPKQIADVLGKTPNHISVLLHGLRKERGALQAQEASVEEKTGDAQHV